MRSAAKPLYRLGKTRRCAEIRVRAPILGNTIGNLVADGVSNAGRNAHAAKLLKEIAPDGATSEQRQHVKDMLKVGVSDADITSFYAQGLDRIPALASGGNTLALFDSSSSTEPQVAEIWGTSTVSNAIDAIEEYFTGKGALSSAVSRLKTLPFAKTNVGKAVVSELTTAQNSGKLKFGYLPDTTGGFYNPKDGDITVSWNSINNPIEIMSTLAHEGLHRYLDRIVDMAHLPNIPSLDEELAASLVTLQVYKEGYKRFGNSIPIQRDLDLLNSQGVQGLRWSLEDRYSKDPTYLTGPNGSLRVQSNNKMLYSLFPNLGGN